MHVAGPDPGNVPVENVKAIHAVLEEQRPRQQLQQAPIAGPALASVMKVGTRVMRGVDWKWGDQVGRFSQLIYAMQAIFLKTKCRL